MDKLLLNGVGTLGSVDSTYIALIPQHKFL